MMTIELRLKVAIYPKKLSVFGTELYVAANIPSDSRKP